MVYLDCAATTPVDPEVLEVVLHYLQNDFGNAGSRTHEYGVRAKQAVERAREQVARVVDADPSEVVFTSGATESNNLAILGLAEEGRRNGRMHIVTSAIEHKAVLEPVQYLAKHGFTVSIVQPGDDGRVPLDAVMAQIRPDTLLVSLMHVNNETGVIQPVGELAAALKNSDIYVHSDAAQGYGKELDALTNQRIDLISVSGHKIYAPKGIGALIARRRAGKRPLLQPLLYGGGQERGLRPGTLPVHLVAGLGTAANIALRDHAVRKRRCLEIRKQLQKALGELRFVQNGSPDTCIASIINLTIPAVDSEAAIIALKGIVAISNGSACTSSSYTPSHVLTAMNLSREKIDGAIRISWHHGTQEIPWVDVAQALHALAG